MELTISRKKRIQERAYAIWGESGRQHGNDLDHWLRAETEIPLRVTFDSNAYRQVICPSIARDACQAKLEKINNALKAGRIRGYLSDTIITLEGIENQDRVQVLGSTRLETQTQATGPNTIASRIGMRQNRKPLNPTISKWIQAAQEIGMRLMRPGSRWFSGAGHITDDRLSYYEQEESTLALVERMERVNKVAEAIQTRGLGYAAAVNLGMPRSARYGVGGELWQQGLGRARTPAEQMEVKKVIAEWADADSIAAHIGYENDIFCTGDFGRSTQCSVLSPTNREWLRSEFGVKFVTLPELSQEL